MPDGRDVVQTRQRTERLAEIFTPLGAAGSYESDPRLSVGYAVVSILALSDQPFTISVQEASEISGEYAETHSFAAALEPVSGLYMVCERLEPCADYLKTTLTNTGGAMSTLEYVATGIPIAVAGAGGGSGSQGPQGPAGTAGPQGATGNTGPQGADGAAGAQGSTGPQGPDGSGSLAIGDPVSGSGAWRILFVDGSSNLDDDAGLKWEAQNVTLTQSVLKVVSAYNQIHFSNVAGDGGGWVGSTGDSQAWLSGGMHYSGSGGTWINNAAAGDPCFVDIGGGEFTVYCNYSLGVGASFTPTRVANFRGDSDGIVFDVALRVGSGVRNSVNASSSGFIRVANNTLAVAARNAANNADIWALYINASNEVILGDGTGANAGVRIQNHAAGKIGVFATTPVVKQAVNALTNNVTAGGSADTIADYSDLTVYANDAATIRNNFYRLAQKVQQIGDSLRAYGYN